MQQARNYPTSCSYHFQLGTEEIELEPSLTLKDADGIVQKYFGTDYVAFLDADIEAREDGERAFSRKLISFIDYVDTDHNYYLDEGTWYQFDRNYVRYLENAVSLIPLDRKPEIVHFDEASYQQWLKDGQHDSKKEYREKYLNQLLADKYGYDDRSQMHYEKMAIEYADLVRDNELGIYEDRYSAEA